MKKLSGMTIAMVSVCAASIATAQDASWKQPHKPFRVYGNTWYVGSEGLSAILITSPKGHILIDGTLPENAEMVKANIQAAGFRLTDIKVILNSHAHGDHAGALAALADASGARVIASPAGAAALMLGGNDPDDPQHGEAPLFPPVKHVESLKPGSVVRVGDLAVKEHAMPGHTPGSSTWTWTSCEQDRCLNMVYADSVTYISADGFHFTDDKAHPHRVEDIRKGLAELAAMPCDVLMTPHPDASDLLGRVAAHDQGKHPDQLFDTKACRKLAKAGEDKLATRLDEERKGQK
ncbi:subclass B3 metallo-beta-lactamase [Dyella terrae]|uniref:subclass B3 metallo-beta-lactamase n=1 Tax=Dyella terrae TaxID=522259 RepID=UPI001F0F31F4|nr:subclass B3 metallo-beta-lactamase [Dyella terrae]